jgi:acyl-CoA reductase-like NAD-dependent aldehyde dehydrogenase
MSYTLINPATEEAMETIEHYSVEQTDDAIARAQSAQKKWAALNPADRGAALKDFAEAVEADTENLAQLEVRNSGHPISQARWEANHVRNVLEYYSASPERLLGKQIPVAGGVDITFNDPLGVVGVITPWNFPMTIASWGFAPALAAGNAVVLKPAEWTPLTSIRLGELAAQAKAPATIKSTFVVSN